MRLNIERDMKNYGVALLELASERNILKEVNDDMEKIHSVFSTFYDSRDNLIEYQDFGKKFLLLSSSRKLEVIKEILSDLEVNKLVYNFTVFFLLSKDFFSFKKFTDNWKNLFLQYQGYFQVLVKSVIPLNKQQKQKIEDIVKQNYGDNFFLENRIDKSILGGLVIYIQSQVLNDSLAFKIKNIENVMKGKSNE